jgi:anthranilate synthase/aminodeoxychorismate synthase-like glutamine amidotransferase
MLVMIDNYDSFVFNVTRYFTELGQTIRVFRNDAITLNALETLCPQAIILSPGPASPDQAGICLDIVTRFSGHIPILGVCLGHQCIGAGFGGQITRAAEPMHGRSSAISHAKTGLFQNLPDPLTVGRYHSLVVRETPELHAQINITARTKTGEIMALAHRQHPTWGVQFHPESVLSDHGHQIFANFIKLTQDWRNHAMA